MKKFKLQRGIISGALAVSMLFSGCNNTKKEENITENNSTSFSSTKEDIINVTYAFVNNEDSKMVKLELTSDGSIKVFTTTSIKIENSEEKNNIPDGYEIITKKSGNEYFYREEEVGIIPLLVEFEQVELEDGRIGYKLPVDYEPYEVNNDYNFPSILGIKERTEEYTIYELPKEIDENGIEVETSFDGAIGIQNMFSNKLKFKSFLLSIYEKDIADNIEDYSFASPRIQEDLADIDALHDFVVEKYNEIKGISLSR